jgi:glycyl-tRNA synthetase beta chain
LKDYALSVFGRLAGTEINALRELNHDLFREGGYRSLFSHFDLLLGVPLVGRFLTRVNGAARISGELLALGSKAQQHEIDLYLAEKSSQPLKDLVDDCAEIASSLPLGSDEASEFYRFCEEISQNLLSFFADRLKVHLRDQGIRHDVIQACFDLGGQDDLVLLVNRVRALQDFLETQDGEHLLVAYRRAANIVGIEESRDGVEYSGTPEAKFAQLDEERALFAALDTAEPAIAAALDAEDFAAAMGEMAKLRPIIDTFFDEVTVNADNAIVRRNRLCLLNRIRAVMRQVAVWEAIEG